MVVGGIVAAALAIIVFFSTKRVVTSERDRVSISALVAGGTCASTGGFMVGEAVGFFVTGGFLILLSLLFAYDNEG
jgi:hypothetical protein